MARSDLDDLRKAAEVISKRAKQISGTFSERIPLATRVISTTTGVVAVITDGTIAPNAAPFEFAEMHPLWAHVNSWRYLHYKWGKQPLRPYMHEAAEQAAQDAAEVYGKWARDYAVSWGLTPV